MDTSLIRKRTQKSGEGSSQYLVTSEDPKGSRKYKISYFKEKHFMGVCVCGCYSTSQG